MREEMFSRETMLVGQDGMERLRERRVAVFGLGGVGGHAAEALARAGVGALDLIDADRVSLSNLNRQLVATLDTVGQLKVEAMAERIARVNPFCRVTCHALFYLPQTADQVDLAQYDYVVDAVDTVSAKVELAVRCQGLQVPLISAMGTGNKMDPGRLNVTESFTYPGMPPGAGHAPGAEEAGGGAPARMLFHRGTLAAAGRRWTAQPYARQHELCARRCRHDDGRGSGAHADRQGSGAMKAEPSGAGVHLHGTPPPFFARREGDAFSEGKVSPFLHALLHIEFTFRPYNSQYRQRRTATLGCLLPQSKK